VRIILLGPPGAGKGTQAEVLCKNFNLPHISTGNMLRKAIESGTNLGLEAKKLMDEGILVSDEVIVALVAQRIKEKDCKSGFLFDGFPRTIPQAEALDKESINIEKVVEIEVPDEEIIRRMSGRRVHPGSGRNYHIKFNPPKVEDVDDLTGEPLIQRDDDKPETVKDRLNVYRSQTFPLIGFYQKKANKKLLNYIKVSGIDIPDEVSKKILKEIQK